MCCCTVRLGCAATKWGSSVVTSAERPMRSSAACVRALVNASSRAENHPHPNLPPEAEGELVWGENHPHPAAPSDASRALPPEEDGEFKKHALLLRGRVRAGVGLISRARSKSLPSPNRYQSVRHCPRTVVLQNLSIPEISCALHRKPILQRADFRRARRRASLRGKRNRRRISLSGAVFEI